MLHHHHQFESLLVLAAISVAYSITVYPIERLRLAVAFGKVPNVLNVWVLAAVMILPAPWIPLLVAVAYASEWPVRRTANPNLGKHIYAGVALAAAGLTAWSVVHLLPFGIGVPAAITAYMAVDTALIAAAITLADQRAKLRMFLSLSGHRDELATAILGVGLAAGMQLVNEAMVLLAVPLLLTVHRRALHDAIRAARAFDPATGLWSRRAWPVKASNLLRRARPGHVVLAVIEPDPGVSAADLVNGFGGWVKPSDVAGRYASGQIVLLMHVGPLTGADLCLDGIRTALGDTGIGASIGYAIGARGACLDSMLVSAMSELVIDSALRLASNRP